jgi:hypothetical protein
MARKRLIKGANAARVEARISRVPADLGSGSGEASSIFGALRAMDEVGASPTELPPASPSDKPAPKRPATVAATTAPSPKRGRLRSSDFSTAERGAILRCCMDYRNRLPTYLLSVQEELAVLDSIIEKCGSNSTD